MAEITDNSGYITGYLEDLKKCLDQASRCEKEKTANFNAAKSKYTRKSDYFDKIKTSWDNIQATNAKALDVKAALEGLRCVCDKLETYLSCDLDIFTHFVSCVKKFSKELEHYHCCVDRLCIAIDKISNTGLQKDNNIIRALQKLKEKYEEAIAAATLVIPEVFATLEELCYLKLKMSGIDADNEDEKIEPCDPHPSEGGSSGDNCGNLKPCAATDDKEEIDPDCKCEEETVEERKEKCEGIKGSIKSISDLWNTHFPLNGSDDNENPKCVYYGETESDYETAVCDKKCANAALEEATQLKNLAVSQKTSIEQSYRAAVEANKC